jgi:GNAT superfamily N-acetyltransferase
MEISGYTAEDTATVAEVVDLLNAAGKVDAPWAHPETVRCWTGTVRSGWDGEAPRCFVARDEGRVVGHGTLWLFEYDNRHLAWCDVVVHPDARRRGHGSALLVFLSSSARDHGRRELGTDGWDNPVTRAFARRHRLAQRSTAVQRRQHLDSLDTATTARLHERARAAAAAYGLLRLPGRTPPELLDAVAEMSAAINDAPTDDLDLEDERFPVERIEGYERASEARGRRLYRVVARHRTTGELAGHTVVEVDAERPEIGHQEDTSVVRRHRGHRLGVLLKTEMLRWLAEVEPQLRTIDTWNTESNDHMIAVNEELGYQVLGRELQFQREI